MEMAVEQPHKKQKSTGKGGLTRYRAFDIAAAAPSPPSSPLPSGCANWNIGLTKKDENRSVGQLLWEKDGDAKGSVRDGKSGVIAPHVEECDDDYNDSYRRNFSKDSSPPIPSAGEAKIKFAHEGLAMFKRMTEMALEFYKKRHPCGADLEAVEILKGCTSYVGGHCSFVHFTVKPKTAAPDDDACLVTINAVLELDKFTRCNVIRGRDLEIYEGCPFICGVNHPPEAFLPYVSIPYYTQQRMKDKVLPLQAISSAVRLAAKGE